MKKIFAALTAAIVAIGTTGCDLPGGKSSSGDGESSTLRTSSRLSSTKESESTDKSGGVPEDSTAVSGSGSTVEDSSSVPEENSAPEESGAVEDGSTGGSTQPDDSGASEDSSGILSELIRSEIKEAIDSYETFIDEYCVFMKKYSSSDNPLTLMSEYMDYLQELTEMGEKFDNMDESDWTAAETAYYTEVLLRCQKKLLDAADEM